MVVAAFYASHPCPRPLELFGVKSLKVYAGFLELVEDRQC